MQGLKLSKRDLEELEEGKERILKEREGFIDRYAEWLKKNIGKKPIQGNHWAHHFKYFDLFQNVLEDYRQTVKFHARELEGFKKVLETGCGTGNLTMALLQANHEVIAVDTNKHALEILKEKCEWFKESLKVYNMNVEKLNFDSESFDGIASMFAIPFVEDNKAYFFEVYRVLRKGGKFTISAWLPTINKPQTLKQMLEEEMKKQGMLPKFEKEWKHSMLSTDINLKLVSERNITPEKIVKELNKAGFTKIQRISKHPYPKHACFLTCRK